MNTITHNSEEREDYIRALFERYKRGFTKEKKLEKEVLNYVLNLE